MSDAADAGPLACPRCALSHPMSERFCRNCGMPLVYAGTREQEPILLDHGIPSMLRRARGFDVPDFLAAGPRDVMVPESGYQTAREVLAGTDMLTADAPPGSLPGIGSPARLAVGLIASVGVAALIVYLFYLAFG